MSNVRRHGAVPARLVLAASGLLAVGIAWLWLRVNSPDLAAAERAAESRAIDSDPDLRHPGDGSLALEDADHGRAIVPPRSDEPASTAVVSADDLGAVLWGYVLDSEGRPIEGANLAWTDRYGERFSASGGSDGSYSVFGLAPGRWFVEVGAQGFRQADFLVRVEPNAGRVRRDFDLVQLETIIVRAVTSDGRPIQDVQAERNSPWLPLLAVATTEPPTAGLLAFRGNWQQRFGAARHAYPFTPNPGEIAKLELFEPLPLFVSVLLHQEVFSTQRVEAGQSEVTFVLDVEALAQHLGNIALTVVYAESGAPIANARVMFGQSAGIVAMKSSDAAGKVQLQGRPPGQYDFHLSAAGRESVRFWVDVPPGGTVERTIALAETVGISGRVVDELGQPFSASIEIAPLPSPGEPSALADRALPVRGPGSRADGSFDLKDLGRGQWLLHCRDRRDEGNEHRVIHMSANVVVDTRGGPVRDLEVRVEPAGTAVVRWLGSGRESLKVRFLDPNGIVRASTRFWSGAPQRVALPQGLWTVRVLDGAGSMVAERGFQLAGEPVVLELAPDA